MNASDCIIQRDICNRGLGSLYITFITRIQIPLICDRPLKMSPFYKTTVSKNDPSMIIIVLIIPTDGAIPIKDRLSSIPQGQYFLYLYFRLEIGRVVEEKLVIRE